MFEKTEEVSSLAAHFNWTLLCWQSSICSDEVVIDKVCDQPKYVAQVYEAQGNWTEAALNYFIALESVDDSEATDI